MQTSTSQAVANIIRSWKDEEPRALWNRLKAKGWPSLLLPEGCRGRWLGPQSVEDVAGYLRFQVCSKPGGGGFMFADSDSPRHDGGANYGPETPAERVESLPTFPALAVYQGFAEDLALPADLRGVVVYMDGPYHGDGSRKITGYKHGMCSRESQLQLARSYDERGAVVAISESVPLANELGSKWRAVQIDHARKGQKRTFGGTDEWVTLNQEPQYIPPKQISMFG
jgi:hypothetical protein